MAGNLANRVDHFAHAETSPISQVVDQAGFFLQPFEHQQVRRCQVGDVNVIANACAIRRRIIGAKNRDIFAQPQSDLQRDGNQMRFRLVVFPLFAGRAGGVEIT